MSETKFKDIANQITSRIEQGIYAAGAKLPPHRELANELGTTPATVSKAYKLLAELGRVESFVGRGTFVRDKSALSQVIQPQHQELDFNFSILQPCLGLNLNALTQAYSRAAETLSPTLLAYADDSGHSSHRAAGAIWLQKHGLQSASFENVLLTNGAQHALSLLVETLTEPGDIIAVEALTYPGILAIANLAGREVVSVNLDDDGLCPKHLRKVIKQHSPKLVICIPSHQNPTGITMSVSRRQAIADVIKASSAYLVEDDIYAFLNNAPIPAISDLLPQQSIYITSLSKAVSPAMRCGYIKAPDALLPVLAAHIRANIWLASPINFAAATDLIEQGTAFELARAQLREAEYRQTVAADILKDFYETASGFHIWLKLPEHWRVDRLVEEAKKRAILVSHGGYFSVGDTPNCVRLSLMSISSRDRFEEGLGQFAELLASKPMPFSDFLN